MITDQVVLLASVTFAGILCQWIAWRVKLPAILFLLLTGIIAGPVTGLLDASVMLGDLLFPFISLSVAMILFEGSLTLKFKEISGLEKVVRRMITFGVPVTWILTSVATKYSLGISWKISLLFGAVVVVTGPTVIVPLLRTVKPKTSIVNILRWEGIVIDPVGATLALLVYEFIIAGIGNGAIINTLVAFGKIVLIGFLLGTLSGWLFGTILRKHLLPEFLHNVGMLSFVGAVFALSNFLQHESGLLTVTVMGIWLANMDDVPIDDILDFKESVSVLLISVLFIVLASRVEPAQLKSLGWSALIIFAAVQFLSRPISIMFSTIGSPLSWPERHMLAWIAPRGIVAAAIASLFTIRLTEAGFPDAHWLVPLTFMIIIGTVVLQSATAGIIAKLLNVNEPYPKGILMIGANTAAIMLGKALKENGFDPLLTDRDWERIENAKRNGLKTYMGEAVSAYSQKKLDLVGTGKMVALTPVSSVNELACLHYKMELGSNNVFMIKAGNDSGKTGKEETSDDGLSRFLFGQDLKSLSGKIRSGWQVVTQELSDELNWETIQDTAESIPLFTISPKGRLYFITQKMSITPTKGWKMITLDPKKE